MARHKPTELIRLVGTAERLEPAEGPEGDLAFVQAEIQEVGKQAKHRRARTRFRLRLDDGTGVICDARKASLAPSEERTISVRELEGEPLGRVFSDLLPAPHVRMKVRGAVLEPGARAAIEGEVVGWATVDGTGGHRVAPERVPNRVTVRVLGWGDDPHRAIDRERTRAAQSVESAQRRREARKARQEMLSVTIETIGGALLALLEAAPLLLIVLGLSFPVFLGPPVLRMALAATESGVISDALLNRGGALLVLAAMPILYGTTWLLLRAPFAAREGKDDDNSGIIAFLSVSAIVIVLGYLGSPDGGTMLPIAVGALLGGGACAAAVWLHYQAGRDVLRSFWRAPRLDAQSALGTWGWVEKRAGDDDPVVHAIQSPGTSRGRGDRWIAVGRLAENKAGRRQIGGRGASSIYIYRTNAAQPRRELVLIFVGLMAVAALATVAPIALLLAILAAP